MKKLKMMIVCLLFMSGCHDDSKSEQSVIDKNEKTEQVEEINTEWLIEDFPLIYQMPELPTGCEITALTMLLHYIGYDVDKVVMAYDYMPRVEWKVFTGEDGQEYGPNFNDYFVGDPGSEGGLVCGVPAIMRAANEYLENMESCYRAKKNISGITFDDLYAYIDHNTPVLVWVTIEMRDRVVNGGWYTDQGDYIDWSMDDHGAVLIGYSMDTVTIADSISGIVEYDREQFETVFTTRKKQCLILES